MTIIADQLSPGVCRGCGRRILWAYLWPSLRPHPLEPPFTIQQRREVPDHAAPSRHHVIGEVDGETSHFHSCPNAAYFRRKGRQPQRQPKPQPALRDERQRGLFE